MKKVRVAQVIGQACNGGVEAVIMNYYRFIDKTAIQFDFLVESESKIINKEEIENMGGKVIIIPPYKRLFNYNKELKRIFLENKYDVIHSNMNTLSVFPLRIAKKCCIKVRVAHSHSTSNRKEWKRNILKNILRPFSKVYATDYFACTKHAAKYLFGKKTVNRNKVDIINNAIDLDRFSYNKESRENVRKELKINNDFVIGHIGRFVVQKNHEFMIEVFKKINEEQENVKLLLVGSGPLKKEIEQKVCKYGLEDKVIFVENTSKVEEIYNAIDCFILPSLYEGLGMVAVEAQASGLKCFLSSEVPCDAKILENCEFFGLDVEKWKNEILRYIGTKEERMVDKNNFVKKGYSLKDETKKLTNKYFKMLKRETGEINE